MSDKTVNKALSPEEATVVSNIQSMLDQLLTMGGAGAPDAPAEPTAPVPPVAMACNPDTMKAAEDSASIDEIDPTIGKGIETTESDSATASDDATPRMEEPQTDPSMENVDEVAKAFLSLIQKGMVKQPVQKQVTPLMATLQAVQKVVDVQKAQAAKQIELETALHGILKGLGVTDQLDIAKSRMVKQPPITAQDNEATLNVILKALAGSQGQNQTTQNSTVRKSNHEVVRDNFGSLPVLTGMLQR